MSSYNNDMDANIDNEILECIKPSSPKSFFLFAGAGSGKTRTLVNVLSDFKTHYGKDFKLRNRKIAIITYTNAAAEEITRRLEHSSIFNVSTIHSFSWELIKNFTFDIKVWLRDNLNSEIAELETQQSRSRDLNNRTSIGRAKKIESKKERLAFLDSIQKFVYNPNGDNITKDSLNHSEVISITVNFIKSKPLFQNILLNKYPIILVDESQDTKKELIEALFEFQSLNKQTFSLGLFGDTMQRIYADGKESLGAGLPDDWLKPAKKMNHRSQKRIVELINKIRQDIDGQEQVCRSEKTGGLVKFFAVSRTQEKPTVEAAICEKMKQYTNDGKWHGAEADVTVLTLEHHMAARRMGFSTFFDSLYEIDSLKTSLLDGTSPSVNLFTKIILPIYFAHTKSNKFEIANAVKQHSPLLNRQTLQDGTDKLAILRSVDEKVKDLLSLWSGENQPTLFKILEKINETGLFKIPSTLKLVLERAGASSTSENSEEDVEVDNDENLLASWEVALSAAFSEIINYSAYINEEASFRTHQGVKGLEFDRVMVIIDDEESRGFMFSYDKLFGLKPLSQTDKKNIEEGKETGIDRTKRLFYVACSRAKESLAVVSYTDNPSELMQNVIRYGWFTDAEVEVLN